MMCTAYDLSDLNLSSDEIEIINTGEELPFSLEKDSGFITSNCSVEFDGKSLVVHNENK